LERFTSVTFRNFKAFKQYSIALASFNVLVGPNNAGKSTVITAFRILAEAMRKARAKAPELVRGPNGDTFGWHVNLADLPVAAENIFSDYDDSEPASIKFRISNGNHLVLYFPEREVCLMFADTLHKAVRTPSAFRSQYDCEVAFVPVLGPVEHNEPVFQKEAARLALITHRASRNFRNIWYHYPEGFAEFRELLRKTWPGMDIEPPKLDRTAKRPCLHMFCVEDRILRELYWAGFGFQVWCQMLTFIVEGKQASLLAIDEPDIYLHSDLQHQLLTILKEAGPDILIATHSTELVSGADPNDIVVVTKRTRSGRRLRDPSQLQTVFRTLGSNLNPTLTQLAKTRRALFVEGRDFQIIAWFAERLGNQRVANRSQFAVIPADGFNPQKVGDVSAGIEATLGAPIIKAAIFDRDYRCGDEVKTIAKELAAECRLVHIHSRKEIENFLLVPSVLERAVCARLEDRAKRTGTVTRLAHSLTAILSELTDAMRRDVQSQSLTRYVRYQRAARRGVDDATLTTEALALFDERWAGLEGRLVAVSGKELFARLNAFLMAQYDVNLSQGAVVRLFRAAEIPEEMADLVSQIDSFGASPVSDA
jgi:hypothetical protein